MPEELKKDLDRVYQGLQHMQVEPTETNLAIMLDTLQVIKKAYAFVCQHPDEPEQAGEEDA